MRLAILLCVASVLGAATYYVDNSCANNGNGTAQSCAAGSGQPGPFNSIANMQAKAGGYVAGDIIYLKRGQVYREKLTPPSSGSAGNPITFDAWGSGAKPILKTSTVVTGWSEYIGGTCNGTSTHCWQVAWTRSASYFFRDGIKLNAGTSQDALTNGQYFWVANVWYVRQDAGNPDTQGNLMEATNSLAQALVLSAKDYVTVNNLSLRQTDSHPFRLITSGASITFNDVDVFQAYTCGQVTAATNFVANRFDCNEAYHDSLILDGTTANSGTFNYVRITDSAAMSSSNTNAATTWALNHLLVDAYTSYPVFHSGAGTLTVRNCIINGSVNVSNGYTLRNTGSGTLDVDYCVLLPSGMSSTQFVSRTAGTLAEGTHNVYDDPKWTTARKQGIFSITADDYPTLADWVLLNALADQYGYKTTLSVSQTDTVSAGDWTTMQGQVNNGHEIVSHTRSHAKLTQLGCCSIRYVGAGSAATMTIGSNTLSTSVTGAADNLSLDLTAAAYDTEQELCAYVDGLAAYTCTQVDAAYNYRVPTRLLASVTGQDIRTSAYQANFDQAAFFNNEITLSKADIESNLTAAGGGAYTVKALNWPGGFYDATTTAAAVAAGYIGARSVEAQTTGNWLTSNLGLYRIASGSMDLYGLSYQLAFENNCNDQLVTANGWTCASVTFNSSDKYRQSYSASFNGTSSVASKADGEFSDIYRGDFVFRWWVKPSALTGTHTLYFQSTDDNNYIWAYLTSAGAVVLSVQSGGAEVLHLNTANSLIDTANWKEIAIVAHAGSYKILIDGTTRASATSAVRPANYTGTAYIGASFLGGAAGNYYAGLMDDATASREGYMRMMGTLNTLTSNGGVLMTLTHGESSIPAVTFRPIFDALQAYTGNVQVMTQGEALAYLRAQGTVQSDNSTLIWNQTANANYSPRIASPLINAGTDLGLTADITGAPIVGVPDIGTNEYQATGSRKRVIVTQ